MEGLPVCFLISGIYPKSGSKLELPWINLPGQKLPMDESCSALILWSSWSLFSSLMVTNNFFGQLSCSSFTECFQIVHNTVSLPSLAASSAVCWQRTPNIAVSRSKSGAILHVWCCGHRVGYLSQLHPTLMALLEFRWCRRRNERKSNVWLERG